MRHNRRMQFRPRVQTWFEQRYGSPTPVQRQAWPIVARGEHVLISAATGAGKSLAAWLPLIDRLLEAPAATRGVRVVYVSPLRALSRDMSGGIGAYLDDLAVHGRDGEKLPRVGLRTGDTSPGERAAQRRQPPEILLTTPESLFVLLGSEGGRRMLEGVESVIIDEIHALIGNKRGAHLALSLERLEALVGRPCQRIGLSATARPLRLVAGFLAGSGRQCRIVHPAERRPPRIEIELPAHPIGHLAGPVHWQFLSERLLSLAGRGNSMLVFCNTRGLVERVAALLAEGLGEESVAAHHGSIGRERRQAVEEGLKHGSIKVVVCSSSLELGIDVGPLDRVCQIGSAGAINSMLQRAGRSRHRPGQTPQLHYFPLNLTDLLDGVALVEAMGQGRLDRSQLCPAPRDVLAQHLVAMVAAGTSDVDELFRQVSRAMPWRKISRSALESLIDMLHQGYVPGREIGSGPIHRSAPGRLSASSDAGRQALLNAGTIPEWFEYEVIAPAEGRSLGRLDEEFAFESSPGQIIQLGGQSWRIVRISAARVEVEAAEDETPNLPFWFGEGPGRSQALSQAVARVCQHGGQGPELPGRERIMEILGEARQALGQLPTRQRIVVERFFDPSGDQHLVIHSLFGARINRAWGLALRKRFCRGFNFELQAAATDNGVLISLGAVHSFELPEVLRWLHSASVAELLTQAMLDTPIFQTRLRWVANTALAIRRCDFNGRVPAQIQRNQTENLIARIFPDQLACLENLAGEREIPDHPLVAQALQDCLEDHLDLPGLQRLLVGLESGRIEGLAVDNPEPSILARALVHAPRRSFLDPAAAEERRTRSFEDSRPRGRASAPRVSVLPGGQSQNHRLPINAAELATVLLGAGYLNSDETQAGPISQALMSLSRRREAVNLELAGGRRLWAHIERLAELRAIWPKASISPFLPRDMLPEPLTDADEALRRLVLARLRWHGQIGIAALEAETGLDRSAIEQALLALQNEGLLHRVGQEPGTQWAPRRPAGVL